MFLLKSSVQETAEQGYCHYTAAQIQLYTTLLYVDLDYSCETQIFPSSCACGFSSRSFHSCLDCLLNESIQHVHNHGEFMSPVNATQLKNSVAQS